MDPQSETLRNQLLDAAAERSPRYTQYQQEVKTMLSNLEARVRFERWMVIPQWIFVVLLTTAFMLIGGYPILGGHHIDKAPLGLWFCIQAVFWLLLGTVFLLGLRFSQLKLDLLTEIKRVEVAVLEVKESLAKSPPSTTEH
jgi:hypothetical protein